MAVFREPASAINIVALGLVAGLVAFITFTALSPDEKLTTGDTTAPAAKASHPDDLYSEPLTMP